MKNSRHSDWSLMFAGVLLLGASPAGATGLVPADPLQGYRPLAAQYSEPEPGRQVFTRYVVREGKLNRIGEINRDLLVQTQHLCVEGKGVGQKVLATALPPYLSVLRVEEYLSEAAKLTVQTQARLEVGLNDCSLHWKTSRRGTLGGWGKGVCMLDFDKRTFAGRCERVAKANLPEADDGPVETASKAPREERTVGGQKCVVLANAIAGELMSGAKACYWVPDAAQKQRLPGLLSRPLALEVDFGQDNGRVSATEVNEGQPLDAQLFAVPPGFTKGAR